MPVGLGWDIDHFLLVGDCSCSGQGSWLDLPQAGCENETASRKGREEQKFTPGKVFSMHAGSHDQVPWELYIEENWKSTTFAEEKSPPQRFYDDLLTIS